MNVEVSIWGWRGAGVLPWDSVGHVMITIAGTNDVILSQFPHSFGQSTSFCGPNNLLTSPNTYATEGRDPSVVFRLQVPDDSAFTEMAANQRARPVWDWDPMPPHQTHCARSSYDSLRAGGVQIDPAGRYAIADGERVQIIPNTLWVLLENLPGVVTVVMNETNLPDNERLAYEADISRYVPFSAWHADNNVSSC